MFIVYFGLLAALGAGLRFALSGWSVEGFSLGNLVSNGLGSFLIGLVAAGFFNKYLGESSKVIVAIALLGALTTFSSYSLEVVQFLRQERWSLMLLCIICHNLVSISACYTAVKYFSPTVN